MTLDARALKEAPGQGGPAEIWLRVRRNAVKIIGGRAVFGLVNLAAAALAARAVGIEAFGVIVMLQAYVKLIDGLLKFESWTAVTKFGAETVTEGRWSDFRRLIGFTLRLDAVANIVGIAIGVIGAHLAARWMGWPPEAAAIAPFFALTIPFINPATATGVVRLFDNLNVLVRQHAFNAIVRLIGAAAIYVFGGGLEALILVWALATVVAGGSLMLAAGLELKRRRLLPKLGGRWSKLTAGFPRIWRFVVFLNISSLLNSVVAQAAVLVVGPVLGTGAAGLFGIVRQLTEPLKRGFTLIGPIIFPELAWLEARRDRRSIGRLFVRTMALSALPLVALCLIFVFFGETLLTLLFGQAAAPAAPLLTAASIAAALGAFGFAIGPVMMTIRKEKALLFSTTVGTIVFCAALFPFIHWWGLLGVGFALLLRQLVVMSHRFVILYRALVSNPARKAAAG